MDIALTVCIATYNRASFIKETIESITSQLEDGVEILVVDGASTDNTSEVVEALARRCPALRYVRLDKKGGVDQDYDRSVELARGEYCWFFSDDDILKPGAVRAVLGAIPGGYSAIVANAEVRDVKLATTLSERRMPLLENRDYADDESGKEQFFRDVAAYLSFIGGLIVNRKVWLSQERSRYHGTALAHVGVLFGGAWPGKARVLSDTWIAIRLGNSEWVGRRFDIWLFRWPALVWSFEKLSDASKAMVCRRQPWNRLRTLVFYRALRVYDEGRYQERLRPLVPGRARRAMMAAIARMPIAVARLAVMTYCFLRRDRMTLYVLRTDGSGKRRS
ncbi:MAG TPA: glycosyltransferase family 2 protein [Vicinamibacterales bacterium]|nr:glycosyltransferase family 2 protein [Vicinamibacterales bacterium]